MEHLLFAGPLPSAVQESEEEGKSPAAGHTSHFLSLGLSFPMCQTGITPALPSFMGIRELRGS